MEWGQNFQFGGWIWILKGNDDSSAKNSFNCPNKSCEILSCKQAKGVNMMTNSFENIQTHC